MLRQNRGSKSQKLYYNHSAPKKIFHKDKQDMAELIMQTGDDRIHYVAHTIPYDHGPVVHIDMRKAEKIVGAARIMPPYHARLIGNCNGMTDSEIEQTVLEMFCEKQLFVTPERVLHHQQLLMETKHQLNEEKRLRDPDFIPDVVEVYQYPDDAKP